MKPTSRRSFLREVAAGAVITPALPSLLEGAVGEEVWTGVRQSFSFRDDKVPMNAANLCPSPTAVAERVAALTRDIDIDCSFQNREKFSRFLEESRRQVAAHLRVSPEEIALVRNTSEANNIINNGVSLQPGDEVVIWEENHPTNNVAWTVRAARFGIHVRKVAVPANPASEEELVAPFVQAFTARTRVLAVTHVSNLSGLKLPIAELCRRAHERNIHVHLDGAQTWGALDVDLSRLGCDSYTASAHKWFMGPKEAGVLFVKAGRISQIWPNIVAPGWGDDADPDVAGARKFESLGQRDDACLAAVADTVAFHQKIGPARIEDRIHQLAGRLKEGCRALGIPLTTPMDRRFSGGVVIVAVPKEKSAEAFERMYRDHGIAGSTTGGLRLCPHIYNTPQHIERALAGLKALKSAGLV